MSAPGSTSPRADAGRDGPLTPIAWSEPIRVALLAAVPAAELVRAFGTASDDESAAEALRRELGEGAKQDAELRAWLWSSWRREQRGLVDALARLFSGHGDAEFAALLRQHGAPTLALAVLSEPGEEPGELVDEALAQLVGAGERKALRSAFERWLAPERPEAAIRGRLIVIGGHPRERERVEALLGPCAADLKWIPAVKGTGRGEARLSLSAVSPADTVLIVTGRVSHTIMHSARREADAQGARCHFVEQLTERQVERLLADIRAARGG